MSSITPSSNLWSPEEEAAYQDLVGSFPPVFCDCGQCLIAHGGVVKSRRINLREALVLCKCKKWVTVPLHAMANKIDVALREKS